jgi:hypothetical protein
MVVDIPAPIQQAVSEAVARHLERELGDRRLLLAPDDLAAAESDVAEEGAQLLAAVMDRCYSITRNEQPLQLAFESTRVAERIGAALVFGAKTARVLARDTKPADSVTVLCAIFNLGIGLVDGLCDEDVEAGIALLELVETRDLLDAAEQPHDRGWLRATLPPALAQDDAAAFTADIIETFFQTLHEVYPNGAWVQYRRRVGTQLAAALEAERRSVIGSDRGHAPEELLRCSRLTSVLPFEIIETLARGEHATTAKTAATLLGEAMWRIDDLVDLCADARSGALNGLLLAATDDRADADVDRLRRLLASGFIASAAAEAADDLLAALQLAAGDRDAAPDDRAKRSFLYFVQRYAGVSAPPSHESAAASDSAASITSSNSASSTGRSTKGGM